MKILNRHMSLLILLFIMLSPGASAGKVVIHSSDQTFDAFGIRDQLLKDHLWQESLRMQQQIKILEALPLGCALSKRPFEHYSCGEQFYRPYSDQQGEVFIQIDPVVRNSQ